MLTVKTSIPLKWRWTSNFTYIDAPNEQYILKRTVVRDFSPSRPCQCSTSCIPIYDCEMIRFHQMLAYRWSSLEWSDRITQSTLCRILQMWHMIHIHVKFSVRSTGFTWAEVPFSFSTISREIEESGELKQRYNIESLPIKMIMDHKRILLGAIVGHVLADAEVNCIRFHSEFFMWLSWWIWAALIHQQGIARPKQKFTFRPSIQGMSFRTGTRSSVTPSSSCYGRDKVRCKSKVNRRSTSASVAHKIAT